MVDTVKVLGYVCIVVSITNVGRVIHSKLTIHKYKIINVRDVIKERDNETTACAIFAFLAGISLLRPVTNK